MSSPRNRRTQHPNIRYSASRWRMDSQWDKSVNWDLSVGIDLCSFWHWGYCLSISSGMFCCCSSGWIYNHLGKLDIVIESGRSSVTCHLGMLRKRCCFWGMVIMVDIISLWSLDRGGFVSFSYIHLEFGYHICSFYS